MKAKELRDHLYGDFIKWLEDKHKVDQHTFSMDVWMTKCWELLYGQYQQDMKAEATIDTVLQHAPREKIKAFLEKQGNGNKPPENKIEIVKK